MNRFTPVALLLCCILAACNGSDDDDRLNGPDEPPADNPVAAPDCLGDIAADDTTWCLDPDTRTVTATTPDGAVDWTITVPADFPSQIDALVLIEGRPWLVADAGRRIGLVRRDRERVVWTDLAPGSGGFVQVAPPYDYDYQRGDVVLSAVGIDGSAYLALDVYRLLPGAERALSDSWQFVGAALQRVEAGTRRAEDGTDRLFRQTRAQRLYSGTHVRRLARTQGGHLYVELDGATERLEADTLMPVNGAASRPSLGGRPYELVLPEVMAALRGDPLDELATRLIALGARARETATATDVIESNAPDAPSPPRTDVDTVERIEYACAEGGTLRLDRTDKLTFNAGGFRKVETREEYRYADCGVVVDSDMADALSVAGPGTYRLDGTFTLDELEDVVFQNYTHARTEHEWTDLTLDGPQAHSTCATGETVYDIELVVSPPSPNTRTTRIDAYERRVGDGVELSIANGAYARFLRAPLGGEQPFIALEASGTLGGTAVGGQAIELAIDPPIERSTAFIDPNAAPGTRTAGRLEASATDGSTLTATAVEAPAPFADLPPPDASAALEVRVANGAAVLVETKSLASLYLPVSLHAPLASSVTDRDRKRAVPPVER